MTTFYMLCSARACSSFASSRIIPLGSACLTGGASPPGVLRMFWNYIKVVVAQGHESTKRP